jgi:hypothetical protein
LLLNIEVSAEQTHEERLYWALWSRLSPTVQTIAIKLADFDSRSRLNDERRKLIRGMLKADADWKPLDYERQDIALGKDLILEFVNNAAINPDVFGAMAALMSHFPRIFFTPGIHILARHQADAGGTHLLSGVNTSFYLEGSIKRFLNIDQPGQIAKDMHQSCLVLLDAVVENGSSSAYYLREQLIRSRRILQPGSA